MAAGVGAVQEISEGGAAGRVLPQLEQGSEFEAQWNPVIGLSCELTVELPLPDFKIADLLKLGEGSVIDAHWRLGRDAPLRLNATLIGWIEFEAMGDNLAARLTELA